MLLYHESAWEPSSAIVIMSDRFDHMVSSLGVMQRCLSFRARVHRHSRCKYPIPDAFPPNTKRIPGGMRFLYKMVHPAGIEPAASRSAT